MKKKKSMYYIKSHVDDDSKIIKTEIFLAPILVIIPLIVGVLLIYDWYHRGFILNELDLFGELILGLVIIFVNILFGIPFIRSLKAFSKKTS